MSGKFASITPEILVRKGDAVPSTLAANARGAVAPIPLHGPRLPHRAAPAGADGRSQDADPIPQERKFYYMPDEADARGGGGPDAPPDKPRRIVITLSAHEYETLGLVAVKKGTTRHQLAQAAMDAYFEWLVAEYGEACSCIVGGALCRCECGGN